MYEWLKNLETLTKFTAGAKLIVFELQMGCSCAPIKYVLQHPDSAL